MKMNEENTLLEKIKYLEDKLEEKNNELEKIKRELEFTEESTSSSNYVPIETEFRPVSKTDACVQTSEILRLFCPTCHQDICVTNVETQTFETDFYHYGNQESTNNGQLAEGSNESCTNSPKNISEESILQSDYIYDENTGMYYSMSTGYYYDSKSSTFIDSQTGTKYLYCPETQTYEHISEETTVTQNTTEDTKRKLTKSSKRRKKCKVHTSSDVKTDEMEKMEKADNNTETDSESCEDGEIIDSSTTEEKESDTEEKVVDDADKVWPPCIRFIVLESESLQIGSLLLVTCTGSTIGRDQNNDMCIFDTSVSKNHAKIQYTSDFKVYAIADLGSQNGTFLNGFRLSKVREKSEFYPLSHGDTLNIGKCKLLLHIHNGTETCNSCEPGQVQAELASKCSPEKQDIVSKEEKEKERKRQLKLLKKKFGLESMDYEFNAAADVKKQGYEDRTKQRQKTKGSDNPYQKDDEPASLDKSLSTENKGYKLLQKMGWSEGQGLGKESTGILKPIPLSTHTEKTGLGATPTIPISKRGNKKNKWTKTQERYQQLFPPSDN